MKLSLNGANLHLTICLIVLLGNHSWGFEYLCGQASQNKNKMKEASYLRDGTRTSQPLLIERGKGFSAIRMKQEMKRGAIGDTDTSYRKGNRINVHAGIPRKSYSKQAKNRCTSRPPIPENASIRCNSFSGCRITCNKNFEFLQGTNVIHIKCENNKWEKIPDCKRSGLPL